VTGTVCTFGSSAIFMCRLIQSPCSSIHACDPVFVHGELAILLSKQLRDDFVHCPVILNVLPSV
jgi:hypothetical protein